MFRDHNVRLELEGAKLPLYKVPVYHLLTPKGRLSEIKYAFVYLCLIPRERDMRLRERGDYWLVISGSDPDQMTSCTLTLANDPENYYLREYFPSRHSTFFPNSNLISTLPQHYSA